MNTKNVASIVVVTALALAGCAVQADDKARGEETSEADTTGKAAAEEMAVVEGDNSHDGMCSGGEIIAGCRQQACTNGSRLPNSQCPTGYYCWCW